MKAIDFLEHAFEEIAKHARQNEQADLIDRAVDQMQFSLVDVGDIARLVLGMAVDNPIVTSRAAGRTARSSRQRQGTRGARSGEIPVLGGRPVKKTRRCRRCGWMLGTHTVAAGQMLNERIAAEQNEPGPGGRRGARNPAERRIARARGRRRGVCSSFAARRA